MAWRNRLGIYGAYFLGMAGIGFTLPYLPLYLRQEGMADSTIGIVSTLAALAGLAQFPIGIWSDRVRWRKPFLIAALGMLAISTWLLRGSHGTIWLGFLVVLFAENGICRATAESLFGAEVAQIAPPDRVGSALGALRFWKPLGIILVALLGSVLAEERGVASILLPLAVIQTLAVAAALCIHEGHAHAHRSCPLADNSGKDSTSALGLKNRMLWVFVAAMILFHVANAPGGIYLGLFLSSDLHAPDRYLSYAFVISMLCWMAIVWPAGRWADRFGRRPLLIAGWTATTIRLALIAVAQSPGQVLAIQMLDGSAQALFIVVSAAWVTDRLADHQRVGEAQVLVGSALVAGSAIGPMAAALLVETMGYRGLFGLLAGVAAAATIIILAGVPETLRRAQPAGAAQAEPARYMDQVIEPRVEAPAARE